MPKLSVIMPVFNTPEKFLRPAIASILNQSFKDFEFIIVNDGSAQPTTNILQEYAKLDPRIQILYQPNQGAASARNQGISSAKGEFIAFMDSDDISLSNRFQEQIHFFAQHPHIDVLGTSCQIIPEQTSKKVSINPLELKFSTILDSCPFCQSSVMLRKSILTQSGIKYTTAAEPSEDFVFWLDLCMHFTFGGLNKKLVHYRWHQNNISNRQADQQFKSFIAYQYQKLSQLFGLPSHYIDLWAQLKQKEHYSQLDLEAFNTLIKQIITSATTSFSAAEHKTIKQILAKLYKKVLNRQKSAERINFLLKSLTYQNLPISRIFTIKMFIKSKLMR